MSVLIPSLLQLKRAFPALEEESKEGSIQVVHVVMYMVSAM
jgi:hypothetical protein